MAFSKTQALDLLQKAIAENRLGHAYLISGSSHAGVEQLSEELAALVLGCSLLHVETHPDFHAIEPESKARKILTEQMRTLEEELHLKPQQSAYKVAVIHDADRMVPAAANAFLKTLEEPPDKTLLLLLSVVPEALLETIRSRCIALPLYETTEVPRGEYEKKMAEVMKHFFSPGVPMDATAAFQLTRSFQALLSAAREEAVEAAEEEFSSEKKQYGKTTESSWEGHREEHFKAAAEAAALGYRSLLLAVVADYFGNRLRAMYAESNQEECDGEEVVRLLQCMEAVDAMKNTLERGVQEPLALEAGFLELMKNNR